MGKFWCATIGPSRWSGFSSVFHGKVINMRVLFLAGAAVLFLATGTAHAQPFVFQGSTYYSTYYGNGATRQILNPRQIMKRCERAGVARECEVHLKRRGR